MGNTAPPLHNMKHNMVIVHLSQGPTSAVQCMSYKSQIKGVLLNQRAKYF